MKIIITGTHFTPAQAVIEQLQEMKSDAKILYFGRKTTREGDNTPSVESQVLPKLGVRFIPIISGRLQRSLTIYTIPSLFKIPIGFIQSFYLLVKEQPDVVLSFGGYVGAPVVLSAWLLSIPVIIHEQTLLPGLANKISAKFSNIIALTLPENTLSKSDKTIITGNPMRNELQTENPGNGEYKKMMETAKKDKLPLIYITGGNQGSHAINTAVLKCLNELTKIACVVHQCGDSKFADYDLLQQEQAGIKNPDRYLVRKWIESKDVALLYKEADFVVTRAGMNTILECCYFAKPMLLVPLPAHKEQTINAHYFSKVGNAQILWQSNLTPDNLLINIKGMLSKLESLREKAKEAKGLVKPDAAQRLALETLLLTSQHD